MKLKKTNLLILVTLIILIFTMSSSAIYPVSIVQNPTDVYASETIIITVTVNNMVRDEEIISARLSPKIDGISQSNILCEEDLPQLENVVTFRLGPFIEGEVVSYKIYLEFQLPGTDDYFSEWYSFTVKGGSRPALSNLQIIYVCIFIAAVVVIAVVCIIVFRKRR